MTAERFPGEARLRRRALLLRVAVGVALVVLLIGLALLWPRPQPGALRVATVTGSVEPTGVLQGELRATRSGDVACYAVASGGTIAVLRFVDGWSADRGLALLDTSGGVVAQPGRTLTVLGAPAGIGSTPGCAQRGRIWTVTSVRLRPAT